jgi:hypothetical protein
MRNAIGFATHGMNFIPRKRYRPVELANRMDNHKTKISRSTCFINAVAALRLLRMHSMAIFQVR